MTSGGGSLVCDSLAEEGHRLKSVLPKGIPQSRGARLSFGELLLAVGGTEIVATLNVMDFLTPFDVVIHPLHRWNVLRALHVGLGD